MHQLPQSPAGLCLWLSQVSRELIYALLLLGSRGRQVGTRGSYSGYSPSYWPVSQPPVSLTHVSLLAKVGPTPAPEAQLIPEASAPHLQPVFSKVLLREHPME